MTGPFPRMLWIVVWICLSGLALKSQTKVAIVDLRQAVNDTAEVKKAIQALEARLKPKQAEAERIQKELSDIQNKLQTLQGKLTPQGESDLVTLGQRRQKELQRLQEDIEAELSREQQEVGTRALQRMREIVKKLAEEQQFDVVVDVSNTVYFKPALDITKTAVAAYDKAFPAK
ncbi:MAG: OmpH family outer membrane protein [Bryobacteraceae bacterium]|nr:OmpH family outer membrane protein [Bryobacteraceae bacterium]MDW8378748.1 OmpH family outer membrane protein [Bryobacterales bacterium]